MILHPPTGPVPMSSSGITALHHLAVHQLASHAAHPTVHPATVDRLRRLDLVEGDEHRLRLTANGWAVVGAAVQAGEIGR